MLGVMRDEPGRRLMLLEETTRARGLWGLPLVFLILVAAWGAPLPLLAYALAIYPGGIPTLLMLTCLTVFAAFWYASLLGMTTVLVKPTPRARSLDLDRETGTSELMKDRFRGGSPKRVVVRLADIERISLEGRHPWRKGTDLIMTIQAAAPSPRRERFRLHVEEVDAHEDARELLFKMASIADLRAWKTEYDIGGRFVMVAWRAEPSSSEEAVPAPGSVESEVRHPAGALPGKVA